jgi:hypothetical protein
MGRVESQDNVIFRDASRDKFIGSCLFPQGVIFGEDVVRFRATVRNYVRESVLRSCRVRC